MELQQAKHLSMILLFLLPVIMTIIGIVLQKFLLHRTERNFSGAQRTISCFTSGIFLGTFLILILPHSLRVAAEQWEDETVGCVLIGFGFFLICLIKILVNLCQSFSISRQGKIEEERLIQRSNASSNENQWTQLITVVFSLGVHYFFNGVLIGGHARDVSTFWFLVIVICFHMCLVAFSITLRLLIDNENYLRIFIGMILWSLMGSLGIFISSYSLQLTSINAILQCLSAGTFLYITFVDMICEDFKTNQRSTSFVNIMLVFGGFLIPVLSSLWQQHPH